MTKKATKKMTKSAQMRKLFAEHPEMTVAEVAKQVGVMYQTAYNIKNEARRKQAAASKKARAEGKILSELDRKSTRLNSSHT